MKKAIKLYVWLVVRCLVYTQFFMPVWPWELAMA